MGSGIVERDVFDRMAAAGEFLEWAEVHGQRYGTSSKLVDENLAAGRDVLLDVDTQGAASVRKLREDAVLIFILPPNFQTMKTRLQGRGLEAEQVIERRIRNARAEVEKCKEFDYVVINDVLETAVTRLEAILIARRSLARRQQDECRRIVATFSQG